MTYEHLQTLQRLLELDRLVDQVSGNVLLIDIEPDEWSEIEGLQPIFVRAAETDQLNYTDGHFDAVVATPNPEQPVHLDECIRVLKDNGKLVFRRAQRNADGQDERDIAFELANLCDTVRQLGCQIEAVLPYGLISDNHALYSRLGDRAEKTRITLDATLESRSARNAWRVIEQALSSKLPVDVSSRHIVVTRKTQDSAEQGWKYEPASDQEIVERCCAEWDATFPLIEQVFKQNSHPDAQHLFAVLIDRLGEDLPESIGVGLARLLYAKPAPAKASSPPAPQQPVEETASEEVSTIRFLCVPDWREDSWQKPVDTYLSTFSAADNVALVLRIEPLVPEIAELAERLVSAIINNCGQPVDQSPDIIIEATPLEPDQEYLLYGSCHGYIPCEGGHDDHFRRKCQQYGLEVIEDISQFAEDSTPDIVTAESPQEATDQPKRAPVSAIVVTHNSAEIIGESLERLLARLGEQDEVLVIDNHSTDETTAIVERYEERGVRIIRSTRNIGFANGLMVGAENAKHELVLIVKPDAILMGAAVDRMVNHMVAHENIAAVGPTTDTIISDQHVSLALSGIDIDEFDAPTIAAGVAEIRDGLACETKFLASLCTLYKRAALLEIAPETIDLFAYGEDFLISYELRKRGHRLLVAQDAFVTGGNTSHLETLDNLKQNYLTKQAANLVYEKLYRDYEGEVPSGEEVFGVEWFKPQTEKTSIIVLAYNNLELTKECITSVYEHTQRDFELILVDNGSHDDVARYAAALTAKHDNVIFIRNPKNQGYAYGCNQGIAAATGEYIVLLNNDIVCTPGWLSKQLAVLSLDDSIGVVGPRTNYAGGPQMIHDVPYKDLTEMLDYAYEWATDHAGQVALLSRLTGLCMVMSRRVITAVGGMDTNFGIGNFEDDDFCLRVMRAGFKLALVNDVFIHHYGSATFRQMNVDYESLMSENFEIFTAKWGMTHKIEEHYNAVDVAQSEAWDPDRDYITPEYSEIFHPQSTPLAVEGSHSARFLCIADWKDPSWQGVVLSYIANTPADGSTALVLRIEPSSEKRAQQVVTEIAALFEAQNIDPNNIPDIILETSNIVPGRRGSLYTACDVLIPCEGSRSELHIREAKACGVAIAGETPTPEKRSNRQEDTVLV
jgi:GT2 family glycosyltransferase